MKLLKNKFFWIGFIALLIIGVIGSKIEENKEKEVLKQAALELRNGNYEKKIELKKDTKGSEIKKFQKELKKAIEPQKVMEELGKLTDEEYENLKNNKLHKKIFENEDINNYFILQISKIKDQREASVLQQQYAKNMKEKKETKKTEEKLVKKIISKIRKDILEKIYSRKGKYNEKYFYGGFSDSSTNEIRLEHYYTEIDSLGKQEDIRCVYLVDPKTMEIKNTDCK